MILRSFLIGVSTTGLLVALLVLSRLWIAEPREELVTALEIETIYQEEPPPPPDLSEPDDPPPPPAPKLELYAKADDYSAPEIALSFNRVDLKTPIESFQTDIAPAKIPVIRQPKPKPAPNTNQTIRPTSPKLIRPTVKKDYYSTGELDGLPTAIRTGQFRWPSRARGLSGKVRLLLEIDQNGRVSVIKVMSTSDPALSAAATRVARGSRFTSPRKNGQKVKARFYKTYVLKKP
ncbi:MAG: energy transducer TonB [Akkermansiaceae bacterium]